MGLGAIKEISKGKCPGNDGGGKNMRREEFRERGVRNDDGEGVERGGTMGSTQKAEHWAPEDIAGMDRVGSSGGSHRRLTTGTTEIRKSRSKGKLPFLKSKPFKWPYCHLGPQIPCGAGCSASQEFQRSPEPSPGCTFALDCPFNRLAFHASSSLLPWSKSEIAGCVLQPWPEAQFSHLLALWPWTP